tara:strand:- start:329 stop:775 length:447 start_codon:yes stop_codon:yes gene_type:complete
MNETLSLVTFSCTIVFGFLLCAITAKWLITKNKAIKLLSLIESNMKEDAKTCSARDMVENQLSQAQGRNRVMLLHNELLRDVDYAKHALKGLILNDENPERYKPEIHNYTLALQKLHYFESKYIYIVSEKQIELDETHQNVLLFKSKA